MENFYIYLYKEIIYVCVFGNLINILKEITNNRKFIFEVFYKIT